MKRYHLHMTGATYRTAERAGQKWRLRASEKARNYYYLAVALSAALPLPPCVVHCTEMSTNSDIALRSAAFDCEAADSTESSTGVGSSNATNNPCGVAFASIRD